MTRNFQVVADSWAKFNSTKQSIDLKQTERTFLEQGAIIEVADTIQNVGNGHVECWVKINVFADHLKELGTAIADPNQNTDTEHALIKQFEGLRLTAYRDAVGIWTIGYGTIRYPNGQRVRQGDRISQKEANEYLAFYINSRILPAVAKIPNWGKMKPHQKEAVISFAYNLGAYFYGNAQFKSMTMLLNNSRLWTNSSEVYRIFGLYSIAGGRKLEGLVQRRNKEAKLFLGENK